MNECISYKIIFNREKLEVNWKWLNLRYIYRKGVLFYVIILEVVSIMGKCL